MHHMAIVSDLHTLSLFGLVPPKYRPVGGEEVRIQTRVQDYLYDCWMHFVDEMPRCEVGIINGDALQGEDRKDGAKFVVTSDMHMQAMAAIELLKPFREKCDELVVIRGTPYHEKALEVEYMAKELDARKWGPDLRYTQNVLNYRWRGITFNLAHHQTRGWIWQAGGLDRMIEFWHASVSKGKLPPIDVIVRSHLHMFRMLNKDGMWAISTPCWQAPTPYAIKVMEYTRAINQLDIGGIIVSTQDGTKETMTIRPEIYEPYRVGVEESWTNE